MFRVKFLQDTATQWGMKMAGTEFDTPSAKQVKEWKDRKLVEVLTATPENPQQNPQAHLSLAGALDGLDQVPTDTPMPDAFKIGKDADPQTGNDLKAGKTVATASSPKKK